MDKVLVRFVGEESPYLTNTNISQAMLPYDLSQLVQKDKLSL